MLLISLEEASLQLECWSLNYFILILNWRKKITNQRLQIKSHSMHVFPQSNMALQACTHLQTVVPVIFIKQHPCWIKSFWVAVRGSQDKTRSKADMLKLVRLEEQNTSIETFKTRSWHAIGWLEAAVLSFFLFFVFFCTSFGSWSWRLLQLTLGHFCCCWQHNERLASEMVVLDVFLLFHTKQQQWPGINCRIIVLIISFCFVKQEHH